MLGDSYSLALNNDDRIVQRFALALLYYATNGPTSWTSGNRNAWLLSSTECDWGEVNLFNLPDVKCNGDVVVWLKLWIDGLSGTIPREIGLLSSLTLLSLTANNLEGTIPKEIGTLTLMRELWLKHNANLSGRVPTELANLSNLEKLGLDETRLTGSIPSNLCSKLQRAWIDCGEIECNCCVSGNGWPPDSSTPPPGEPTPC